MESSKEKEVEKWWEDHPEFTQCKLCGTVVKKSLTSNSAVKAYLTSDRLCPDCLKWQNIKVG
jgi:hypothetical protein